MELKTLAKNSAILASPKVLNFFVGILRSKLIAIFLGTTGFGIIDQLTSTVNLIRRSTLSFLPDGMVKLIAEERAGGFDKGVIAEIIKTFLLMVIPLMIIVPVVSFIFADEITLFILGDLKYKKYFLIALISLPISFFGVSFRSMLKAFKEIKSFALAEVYIMIINLIFFIPLIYFYGVLGGVVYVTLSFFVSFSVVIYLVNKNVFHKYGITIKSIRDAVFSTKYFKEMLAFIGVGMIAGSFRVFENMATRAIVVNELGIDKIGIYGPIMKWQALFMGFILPSIFTYLYPRLSEINNDNEKIIGVTNDVLRMISFLAIPFVIIGISTREIIIPLFYSNDFIEAATYLPFHFSFIFLALWATIFEQIFAPTGRLRVFLVFSVIITAISLFLVYYYVPQYGLYGYMLRYTVTPMLSFLVYFVYWRKEIHFRIKKGNLILIGYALLAVSILLIVRNTATWVQILLGAMLLAGSIFLTEKRERDFIMNKISTILRIKK
jgi:PST family polysaccharide transporter